VADPGASVTGVARSSFHEVGLNRSKIQDSGFLVFKHVRVQFHTSRPIINKILGQTGTMAEIHGLMDLAMPRATSLPDARQNGSANLSKWRELPPAVGPLEEDKNRKNA
jgi:hypothetical protein